ncbi:MAG: phBC6A51 family helix-turn-helix protein [Magnetococcus sp. YQC-5]
MNVKYMPKKTGNPATIKQIQAAELLASGTGVKEAAMKVGVNRSTIWAWKQNEEFSAFVGQLRQEILETGRERLRALALTAVSELEKLMTAEETKPHVRLQAIAMILKMGGIDAPLEKFGWGFGAYTITDGDYLSNAGSGRPSILTKEPDTVYDDPE